MADILTCRVMNSQIYILTSLTVTSNDLKGSARDDIVLHLLFRQMVQWTIQSMTRMYQEMPSHWMKFKCISQIAIELGWVEIVEDLFVKMYWQIRAEIDPLIVDSTHRLDTKEQRGHESKHIIIFVTPWLIVIQSAWKLLVVIEKFGTVCSYVSLLYATPANCSLNWNDR